MKKNKKNLTKEIAKELEVFDEMLSALVELLECEMTFKKIE